MEKVIKEFNCEIKDYDDKEMALTAVISTGAVDRQKESLDPDGVDLSAYRKNPVVLWAHNYDMPPIGKAVWAKKQDGGIISKVRFYSSDGSVGEFAKEIYQMYKEKYLSAFSVGFIPKEVLHGSEKDYNDPKRPNRTYKKWEMIEYSAVPVPANPEALALAFKDGKIKSPLWKSLVKVEEKDLVQEFNNEENETKNTVNVSEIKYSNSVLDDLMAEDAVNKELIEKLEKENAELRGKLFIALKQQQQSLSEITAGSLAKEVEEIVGRVVRKAMGKVD